MNSLGQTQETYELDSIDRLPFETAKKILNTYLPEIIYFKTNVFCHECDLTKDSLDILINNRGSDEPINKIIEVLKESRFIIKNYCLDKYEKKKFSNMLYVFFKVNNRV